MCLAISGSACRGGIGSPRRSVRRKRDTEDPHLLLSRHLPYIVVVVRTYGGIIPAAAAPNMKGYQRGFHFFERKYCIDEKVEASPGHSNLGLYKSDLASLLKFISCYTSIEILVSPTLSPKMTLSSTISLLITIFFNRYLISCCRKDRMHPWPVLMCVH
jgi:hypothetical protein